MRGGWRAGAAALAAALALAGCGGGGSHPAAGGGATTAAATTTTAASGFCADLAALQRAAGDFRGLDPANTSVAQLALYAANLGSAWKRVRASSSGAAGVDTTALTAAWRDVLAEAKRLTGGGASPAAAVQALKDAAVPLRDEADKLAPRCAG